LITAALRYRHAMPPMAFVKKGVLPAAVTVALMAIALAGVRWYQHRSVVTLAEQYSVASLEPLAIGDRTGSRL
jgi:hypothetical protein